jgi:RimJ/RimL family protein N-acetyltransferase
VAGRGVLRRTALNGRFCRLEPLDVERHAADLFAAYALGDDSDWTWLASTCPQSVESTAHWIAGKVMDDALVPYAVIDLRAERAVGLVSYMAIERAMGTVEIGHVTWSRAMKTRRWDRSGGCCCKMVLLTAIVGWSGNAIR